MRVDRWDTQGKRITPAFTYTPLGSSFSPWAGSVPEQPGLWTTKEEKYPQGNIPDPGLLKNLSTYFTALLKQTYYTFYYITCLYRVVENHSGGDGGGGGGGVWSGVLRNSCTLAYPPATL